MSPILDREPRIVQTVPAPAFGEGVESEVEDPIICSEEELPAKLAEVLASGRRRIRFIQIGWE